MHSGSKFRSVITSIFHQSLGYLWEIVEKMKGLVDSLNWNKVGLLVIDDCSVCFVCLSLYMIIPEKPSFSDWWMQWIGI